MEDERKERKSYEKLNQVVYGTLLYAVDDEISFNAVNTAISDRFLNVCARTAWKKLKMRWEPSTMTMVYELEAQFTEDENGRFK